jgi:hypothetical protein
VGQGEGEVEWPGRSYACVRAEGGESIYQCEVDEVKDAEMMPALA